MYFIISSIINNIRFFSFWAVTPWWIKYPLSIVTLPFIGYLVWKFFAAVISFILQPIDNYVHFSLERKHHIFQSKLFIGKFSLLFPYAWLCFYSIPMLLTRLSGPLFYFMCEFIVYGALLACIIRIRYYYGKDVLFFIPGIEITLYKTLSTPEKLHVIWEILEFNGKFNDNHSCKKILEFIQRNEVYSPNRLCIQHMVEKLIKDSSPLIEDKFKLLLFIENNVEVGTNAQETPLSTWKSNLLFVGLIGCNILGSALSIYFFDSMFLDI